MPDIALISFDGDGTLWDFNAVMRRALPPTISLSSFQAKKLKPYLTYPSDVVEDWSWEDGIEAP